MAEMRQDNKKFLNAQVKISGRAPCYGRSIHFATIGSTNTWAKKHSEQWAAEGITLVSADEQTAGRGRFSRVWESPAGVNIYATFCFWIDLDWTDLGHIPQLLALAAVKILEQRGFSSQIKWPNDLILGGKKAGGVLCETIIEEGRRGVVCAIGMNINMTQEMIQKIDRPATSLLLEGGKTVDLPSVLEDLKQCFADHLGLFFQDGFDPFIALFQRYLMHQPGDWVKFHDNQHLLEAQFEEYASDGSVILTLRDGLSKRFYAGEFVI